jgi:quinolinate synthase
MGAEMPEPSQKLIEKINELRRKKRAVILSHNYQASEIQNLADVLGDSLELARASKNLDAKLVVFCGVDFMAEMTAMLNPDKKVLLPDSTARCPMAAQLPAEEVMRAKRAHPEAAVVLYVNTLAEAKAQADVVCTSANAPRVINALSEDTVLFGPDRNLAWFVQQRSEKKIIPIPERGYCYVHRMFSPADILLKKEKFPDAEVLAHPECEPEVQRLADHICSTSQMLYRSRESPAKRFIIATEVGMVDRLRRELPEKGFVPALETALCEEMKRHSLEKLYLALRDERNPILVPEPIARAASGAIERMFELMKR